MGEIMKLGIVILLLVVSAFSLQNQTNHPTSVPNKTEQATAVDAIVGKAAQQFMSDKRAVGLSVGIVKDGNAYTYNYGEVEKGKKEVPTEHTIYELASITKTFTGVLLAAAVIEHEVKLDDDVRKYLHGDYPNLEFEGQPIKLVHLINHTSGLPFMLPDRSELFQNPDPIELPKRLTEIDRTYTREDFYRDLHRVRLDKLPGTDFKYSNAAAQLLGFILERIYQQPFEKLVAQKITDPLKMSETKITLSSSEKKRLAKGHYENGTVSLYSTPQSQAAGGLRSSVADMLEYIKFQLNETNQAIKLSHQTTWGDAKIYASGLNWQMNTTLGGNRRIWQSGGSFGFSSHCIVLPELGLGIVLLSNESDKNSQDRLSTMANEILAEMGAK
jgi:serine-type D-Ala-D-Ala carboxypeptidase/endopeptidase